MNGLNQIRDAVIRTLTAAGLTAVAAWDGNAGQYDGAVIAADVAKTSEKPAALGGYLGEVYDEKAGTVREKFGRRLEVTISLAVRAECAADCETGCEAAADALLSGGLPSGLRPGEQSWEAVTWDKSSQMFLRRGGVKCGAYFTAEADPESGTLRDFILKGVLTT